MSRIVALALVAAVALLAVLWWAGARAGERAAERMAEPAGVSRASEPMRDEAQALAPRVGPRSGARPAPERAPVEPSVASKVSVRARVLTRTTGKRDSAPVGGLTFEVLAQRSRVGMPVTVGTLRTTVLPLELGDAALCTGRTDAAGEALVELDGSRLLPGAPLLCARVIEPGYQQQLTLGRFPESEPALCELVLTAARGATVRGRVTDQAGKAEYAAVRLGERSLRQRVPEIQWTGFGFALLQGGFELHASRAIADAFLVAEDVHLGTGVLTGVVLGLDAPPQDLRLVVSGPGVLRGRVLDAEDAPVEGLALKVVLAAVDEDPARRADLEALGGGFLEHTTSTDAHGRFEVRALRTQLYCVRARVGTQSSWRYPQLLTPAPVVPDGVELTLRAARPHVVVRLRDSDGSAGAWSRLSVASSAAPSNPPGAWPENPRVLLLPCADSGAPCVTGEPLSGNRSDEETVVFEVEPSRRYLVGALGGDFDGVLQVVDVPASASVVPVELRARALEFGTVALRVFAGGAELSRNACLALALESPGAASLLAFDRSKGPPFTCPAPAGSYRVVAAGAPLTNDYHGYVYEPRSLGRAEAEVTVRAGETCELSLTLDSGARLEVSSTGTIADADRAAVLAQDSLRGLNALGDLEHGARQMRLVLERPGHRPEPVVFRAYAGEGTSSGGEHLFDAWPLGETHVSEVLPSGQWTLVGRLPGGREQRRELELGAGTTTRVTLAF